jgi:hypothetical protein
MPGWGHELLIAAACSRSGCWAASFHPPAAINDPEDPPPSVKDAIGWEKETLFPPMAFEEAEDQTARHGRSHRAPVKRHSACTVSLC